MERKKKCLSALILFFVFSVLNICSVGAKDDLYLTGFLKSVDIKTGKVMVDVKSQSCPGLRRFNFDKSVELEGLEGRKISFSIDSSVCRRDEIHNIVAVTLMQEVKTK
jgi:hypothetical protein